MNTMPMTPVKQAPARYMWEFGVSTGLYVIAIVAREQLARLTGDPVLHVAIVALPVLPIWLMLLAVVRHYYRIDELAKMTLLRNVAVSAGLMSCLVTSYALLEDAGLPALSITWAWPTLATCWAVTTAVNTWRAQ